MPHRTIVILASTATGTGLPNQLTPQSPSRGSIQDLTPDQFTMVAALTVPQAAEISQLCHKTIYDAIKRGLLARVPHIRVIRIPIEELNRFLTGRTGQITTCQIAKTSPAKQAEGHHE